MIPPFNIYNLLPPIRPGAEGHSSERSPYATEVLSFCERFCTSPVRQKILHGYLDLREVLRQAGLEGFQWVNGSFTENVEVSRRRDPGDIDVVTFASLGSEEEQRELLTHYPELLSRGAKKRYFVDHYMVATDVPLDAGFAAQIAYWYSMWSHRREDHRWKGFLSIELSSNDVEAREWLKRWKPGGQE